MGLLNKILLKLAGSSEELEAIYKEKGLCRDYADGYYALNNKNLLDKCHSADKYLGLYDYEKAEEIINSINYPRFPNDDQLAMYNFVKLILCVNTNRINEASDIMSKHGKVLNIYWGSPAFARASAPYYDCIATLCGLMDDEERAMYWLNVEAGVNDKYDKTGIMSIISKCNVLFALKKLEAETEYENAKKYIEEYNYYNFPWQKDSFLKMLEHAKVFCTF